MNQETPLNTLAFDTAMNGISVGAQNNSGDFAQRRLETDRGQAAHLIPLIQECLSELKLSFQDLDVIGVTRGPGSFTGLRIALTTAKTLGLSLKIPVIGLNTLDLIAQHLDEDTARLVILETKRQDFYACFYDKDGEVITSPVADSAASIMQSVSSEPFTLISDCSDRFKSALKQEISNTYDINHPEPSVMVQMTQELFTNQESMATEPLYLRGADISQPKQPPRKLREG